MAQPSARSSCPTKRITHGAHLQNCDSHTAEPKVRRLFAGGKWIRTFSPAAVEPQGKGGCSFAACGSRTGVEPPRGAGPAIAGPLAAGADTPPARMVVRPTLEPNGPAPPHRTRLEVEP